MNLADLPPAGYLDCGPRNVRLSEVSCAADWSKAKRDLAPVGLSRDRCRGCAIGARHAGSPPPPPPELASLPAVAEASPKRVRRKKAAPPPPPPVQAPPPGKWTTHSKGWGIRARGMNTGGHAQLEMAARTKVASRFDLCNRCIEDENRLISGAICVSCYNRQREAEVGVNRRGNPVAPMALRSYTVMVCEPGRPPEKVTLAKCLNASEILVHLAKAPRGPEPVCILRVPRWPALRRGPQLVTFPGSAAARSSGTPCPSDLRSTG